MIIKATDPKLRSIAAKLLKSEIAEVNIAINKANELHGMVAEQAARLDAVDRAMAERQAEQAALLGKVNRVMAERHAQHALELKQARVQGNTELRQVARQVKQLQGTVERLLRATADRGNRGK